MRAEDVAKVLNRWWPIAAGPPPEGWADVGVPWHVVAQQRVSFPPATGAIAPLRWARWPWILWQGDVTSAVQYGPGGSSPAAGEPIRGLRMIADRPLTVDRPMLVLPSRAGEPSQPAAASRVSTYVLTCREVAADLEQIADRPDMPARQLRREAGSYTSAADTAELDLDRIVAPWWELATAAVAAAASAARRQANTSPPGSAYRRVPIDPSTLR
jgi:hypothetical protein